MLTLDGSNKSRLTGVNDAVFQFQSISDLFVSVTFLVSGNHCHKLCTSNYQYINMTGYVTDENSTI